MASATISPPSSFAGTQGTVGFSYVYAEEMIRQALADTLDAMSLGVIPLVGDLVGSGSDVVRITDIGNVGWNRKMTSLANETDTVAPSSFLLGYETVTLGSFGLSHSETYKQQILNRQPGVTLDDLIAVFPQSWMATFRERVCVTGATISASVGATGTALSLDDWFDLATAFRTTLGARQPVAMLDPTQYDQLLRSARNEPSMQSGGLMDFAEMQRLRLQQVHPDFAGMGIGIAISDDIQQAGGAYQGFAFSQGGIGWARASTSPVVPANPQGAMYLPEFGALIEELTTGGAQTVRQYRATSWIGFGLASTRTHKLSRILSAV